MQGDLAEERLSGGTCHEESVTTPALAGLVLGGDEGTEMRFVLDLLAHAPGALMTSDLEIGVEHTHERLGGDERERLLDQGVRDRVVILVEAQVRGFPGANGPNRVRREGMRRQRQEARLLFGKRLDDAFLRVAGDVALVCDVLDPAVELPVEIDKRAEGAGGEERFPEVPDTALDTALLVAACHGDGLRREVVVAGELEDAVMKTDEVALALEDDAFQVIVEDGPRNAAEPPECFDVAAQEALERLVEREAREGRPRPGEDQHEARERALGVTDADLPERPPVDLGFFPWQRAQAEKRLVRGHGTDAPDVTPERENTALIAASVDHLEQPRRAEPRVLLERHAHEVAVRIEDHRLPAKPRRREA